MTKTKTEMKRIAVILFLLFAFFSLSACEPGNESSYKPVEQPRALRVSRVGTTQIKRRETRPEIRPESPPKRSRMSNDRTNPTCRRKVYRAVIWWCTVRGPGIRNRWPNRSGQRCVVIFWRWNLLHPMSRTTKRCLPGLRRRLPRFVPAVIHR